MKVMKKEGRTLVQEELKRTLKRVAKFKTPTLLEEGEQSYLVNLGEAVVAIANRAIFAVTDEGAPGPFLRVIAAYRDACDTFMVDSADEEYRFMVRALSKAERGR